MRWEIISGRLELGYLLDVWIIGQNFFWSLPVMSELWPHESKSPFCLLNIYNLIKLFNIFCGARDIFGHLNTGDVLDEIARPDTTINRAVPTSDPFSCGFVKRKHVSLSLCCGANDVPRILLKLVFLLESELCIFLLKLKLFFNQSLMPGPFFSLKIEDQILQVNTELLNQNWQF